MTTIKTTLTTGAALLFTLTFGGCNRSVAPGGNNSDATFQSANAPDGTRTEGAPSDAEPTRIAQSGAFRFNMNLDPSPARAGVPTTINLLALEGNSPLVGGSATVDLTQQGASSATLSVPLNQTAPGTLSATTTFPAPGAWTADVTAKRQANTGTARFTINVSPARTP
jgi:hypothetical protein